MSRRQPKGARPSTERDEDDDSDDDDEEEEAAPPVLIGPAERCPHCHQVGYKCFDLFFGPYCVKTASSPFLKKRVVLFDPLDHTTPDTVTAAFEACYRHHVHFYVHCITGEYDTVSYADIPIPQCVRSGSLAFTMALLQKVFDLREVSTDMTDNLIQAYMLLGYDNFFPHDQADI